MLIAFDLAGDDLDQVRRNLELWYDSGMDRVSGWYRRSTQKIVFLLALAIAIIMNVDTIGIANFLYQNDTARQLIVAQAEDAVADAQAAQAARDAAGPAETSASSNANANAGGKPDLTTAQQAQRAREGLEKLQLPIGWDAATWSSTFASWGAFALVLVGWVITAFAATLGAPFWFDVLNKVMVIRSTVKPYEKSKPEASEDRQPPRTTTSKQGTS